MSENEHEHEEMRGWFCVVKEDENSWVEPTIHGEIHRLDAYHTDEEGIEVDFYCGPWLAEAMFDSDQAGELLAKLTEAIADYDREMAERRRAERWACYCRSRVGCADESPDPAVVRRADAD
jgi:hypothetical protein